MSENSQIEAEILAEGDKLLKEVLQRQKRSILNPQFYADKFLAWGMQDEELKVALFRFVDVLPVLTEASSVTRHVQEYFEPLRGKLPELFRLGLDVSGSSLASKVASSGIKKQVSLLAEHFILGSTPQAALRKLHKLRKKGQAFTVDLLGEATLSEVEAVVYRDRYLELLNSLAAEVPKWKEAAAIIPGQVGEETPINISVKPSALYSQARVLNSDKTISVFTERLGDILRKAKSIGAFVYVDMEDSPLTSLIIDSFKRLLSSEEFKDYERVGLVLQAYLRRTSTDLSELLAWAGKQGRRLGIRLVKGAYWDSETILARLQGFPSAVWSHKCSTDANYEKLSRVLLDNIPLVRPAFASHNLRSLLYALKYAEFKGIAKTELEVQVLYGMGAAIADTFAERGYLVRHYAPVGELIPGMGYLVRRLLENTSNEGFLRQSMHEHRRSEELFAKPEFHASDSLAVRTLTPQGFNNLPLTDFTEGRLYGEFAEAIRHFPLYDSIDKAPLVQPILDGKAISADKVIASYSPEDNSKIVARVQLGVADHMSAAIRGLESYFPVWRERPVKERAKILENLATAIAKDRYRFAAAIVWECGKPWAEADADVAEAVDFCRYYAEEARNLFAARKLGNLPGESNILTYEPRGVAVVICPWNFPLAIPCGMLVAALVTGNTAVLKPAEQSSLVAQMLFKALLAAGLPPQAAAFVPASGEDIGSEIFKSPAVATIVFTGSKEVGLHLIEQGGRTSADAWHVRRVIAEMGGKNAIIIDDDADIDEAIKGVVHSAFSYAGQKCSACSRLIVLSGIYEKFLARLKDAVQDLLYGPASQPATVLSPLIDQESMERVRKVIESAKKRCRLVVEGATATVANLPPGNYLAPVVFADVPQGDPLLKQEIFGPVLAVMKAQSFPEALSLANDSEFALTGAVYSRSPRNIALAREGFRVGNLYINRGSTGAMVGRQPFGGAKMSGVGSKAGGQDYLFQFVTPKVLSENTLRRGFAPADSE